MSKKILAWTEFFYEIKAYSYCLQHFQTGVSITFDSFTVFPELPRMSLHPKVRWHSCGQLFTEPFSGISHNNLLRKDKSDVDTCFMVIKQRKQARKEMDKFKGGFF